MKTARATVFRKYRIHEIDEMRRSLEIMLNREGILDPILLEERLRTYILAGIDPEDMASCALSTTALMDADAACRRQ